MMQPGTPKSERGALSCSQRAAAATVLLAIAAGGTGCFEKSDSAPHARHLLLISIDTLRPDLLGCYGYPRPTSPNLDRLAAEGVLFENAKTTSPWTLPSHGTLLTGLYPSHHGSNSDIRAIADGTRTLAEQLAAQKFWTGAVTSTPWLGPRYRLDRGFGTFAYLGVHQDPQVSGRVVERAIELLPQPAKDRIFLFVHDYQVHSSYTALPIYMAQFVSPYSGTITGLGSQLKQVRNGEISLDSRDVQHLLDLYAAGVRQLDSDLGRLLDHFEAAGLLEETLIVVTADHGEEFMEHGGVLHGRTHYEELMRVPLILRGPGVPRGVRISEPVSLVDVVPTAMALLGLPLPEAVDGIDLRSHWSGSSGRQPAERVLFGEADHNSETSADTLRSAWQGRWKLHLNRETGKIRLYDLEADPAETTNLAAAEPKRVEQLRGEIARHDDTSVEGHLLPEMSADERNQLRALGYLSP